MVKILTSLHTLPNVGSIRMNFFDEFLPVLRSKTDVEMVWFVYKSFNLEKPEFENDLVLDFHDFENAVDLLQKTKPDIVYAVPTIFGIDYAIASAARKLEIPIFCERQNLTFMEPKPKNVFLNYISLFFESTVPSNMEKKTHTKIMGRGLFFIQKLKFILNTEKELRGFFSQFKLLLKIFSFFFKSEQERFINAFSCDLYFLLNENLKQSLLNAGLEKNSLIVTGSPSFDPVFKKTTILKRNNLSHSRILLLTQSYYEHGYWTKEQKKQILVDSVSAFKKTNYSLKIKIHPSSEILSDYQKLLKNIDTSIPVFQRGDLVDFLKDADLILTWGIASSVIYPILMGKPIVLFNPFGTEDEIFIKNKFVFFCDKKSDIIPTIKKAFSIPISEDHLNKFIKTYLFSSDGKAAERISEHVLEYISKNNKRKTTS